MRHLAVLVPLAAMAACSPNEPAQSAPAPAASASGAAAQFVNATILTNGCQALGSANAKLAESAMYRLVEGCSSVPGGSAGFEATLQPGGRIEIAAAPGQPDTVPICVLKHSLTHKVPLTASCRLDVHIEQTSVALAVDGGAR